MKLHIKESERIERTLKIDGQVVTYLNSFRDMRSRKHWKTDFRAIGLDGWTRFWLREDLLSKKTEIVPGARCSEGREEEGPRADAQLTQACQAKNIQRRNFVKCNFVREILKLISLFRQQNRPCIMLSYPYGGVQRKFGRLSAGKRTLSAEVTTD